MILLKAMKHIKQLTFNITQSRRIKNYSQKNNIPEKELLAKYRVIMDIVYSAWMKNREINPDLQFRTFFLNIMKYAEFAFRLDVRKEDLVKITEHVEILEGAIEEYNQDYAKLIKIEEVVKDYEGRNVE